MSIRQRHSDIRLSPVYRWSRISPVLASFGVYIVNYSMVVNYKDRKKARSCSAYCIYIIPLNTHKQKPHTSLLKSFSPYLSLQSDFEGSAFWVLQYLTGFSTLLPMHYLTLASNFFTTLSISFPTRSPRPPFLSYFHCITLMYMSFSPPFPPWRAGAGSDMFRRVHARWNLQE